MSQVYLLPRLGQLQAYRFMEQIKLMEGPVKTPDRQYLEDGFSAASYAATGGTISEKFICDLADRIRMIASRLGFSDGSSGQEQRSEFDKKVSILLALCPELRTGEALRDDVWTFLSIVLLPDVVAWRFQSRADERYFGGVRNAFQRLWVRGVGLDRGEESEIRWELVSELTEDGLVQIFERASIASNHVLTRAIAETWLVISRNRQVSAMEDVARSAIKMIRLRNEIVDIGELEEAERNEVLSGFFMRAVEKFYKVAW